MEDQENETDIKTIFIDSDAFVASIKEDDANHDKAKHIFEEIEKEPVRFCTSNYVFSEVVTVISQKVGHQEAIEFIETTTSPTSYIDREWVTPEIEERAIRSFRQQTSKNVSFVDCTNMALMEKLNIDYIFSFDGVYKKNGFHTLEEGVIRQL